MLPDHQNILEQKDDFWTQVFPLNSPIAQDTAILQCKQTHFT